MKSSILYALGASLLEVSALPNPLPKQLGTTGQTYSIELSKKSLGGNETLDEILEKRVGTVTASVAVSPISTSLNDKYTIPMKVGGQTFDVVFDTGSQDFWLESNQLSSSQSGSNHPVYTPGPSASSVPGATWTATFDGDTSPVATGVAYVDQVAIGSAVVPSQTLGAATYIRDPHNQKKSGIIGFAPTDKQFNYRKNTPPLYPVSFMGNIGDSLPQKLFTVDLKNDNTGLLNIGYIDSKYSQSVFSYADRHPALLNYANWYISGGAYYVGGAKSTVSAPDYYHPDTGAPFMYFPKAVVDSYYKQVQGYVEGSNPPRFPCSTIDNIKMPSFGFDVKDTTFTVRGDYMWYRRSPSDSTMCEGALRVGGSTAKGSDGQTKVGAIIGDMFLRTVVAVYKYDGPGSVGFAAKKLVNRYPVPT